MDNNKKTRVYNITDSIIRNFSETLENSYTKAVLAKLRNSIGRENSQTVFIWEELFSRLPEEFLSNDGKVTPEEKAIISSLQMYSLHQQGKSYCVHDNTDKSSNIGKSFRKMRENLRDSKSTDDRFNAMITSPNIDELLIHLRHLIKIFKSNSEAKIDYAKLSSDLFWLQKGYSEQIKFNWGRSYYFAKEIGEKNEK